MLKQFVSHSVEETERIAEQLGQSLTGGQTILLQGDMGAGKTHFVKGLAWGLGIQDVITSPTFALHNTYQGRLTLNHFDFYRVDDYSEVEMLGLDEFFYDRNGVSAIEWSGNVKPLIPPKFITVTITKSDEDTRSITIEDNEI